jgi:hypothetical protein
MSNSNKLPVNRAGGLVCGASGSIGAQIGARL